ncbi:MAG: hypothetical protein H7330_03745 [Hymenobacteraceae bacterium]|nr:hypothetical protein [Hymenobacteraceae bacterium]
MRNEIPLAPVEGVSIAIAPDEPDQLPEATGPWSAWLLNHNDYPLTTVLVVSEGYGEHEGRPVTTSKLRYFLRRLGPGKPCASNRSIRVSFTSRISFG